MMPGGRLENVQKGYPIFTTRIMAESHLQRCAQIACFLSRAASSNLIPLERFVPSSGTPIRIASLLDVPCVADEPLLLADTLALFAWPHATRPIDMPATSNPAKSNDLSFMALSRCEGSLALRKGFRTSGAREGDAIVYHFVTRSREA